ncbi:hypothetical protein [Paraglaciecola aestuariivivens]
MSVLSHQAFIEYCQVQLQQVFQATKQGAPDLKAKHQVQGLLRAAELLGVITREQATALIEQQHFVVFGQSVQDREQRKRTLAAVKGFSASEFFDIPAIERRK